MTVSNAIDTGPGAPTQVVARRINHVSINAVDIDDAGRFYEELLGMEKLPTPAVLKLAKLGDKAFRLLGIAA